MSTVQERLKVIRGVAPLAPQDQAARDIRDVSVGGYLEFRDDTWLVRNVYRYLDVKWKNFALRKEAYWVTELELFSLNTGAILFVEWEFDDELEVYVTTKDVRLKDIQYHGQAIKFDDLVEIAEEEEGTVTVNGQSFYYSEDDTWAGRFFRGGETPTDEALDSGAPVRFFEFESDGDVCLSIEAWEEEPDEKPDREAFLSVEANPRDFTVLQTQAASL